MMDRDQIAKRIIDRIPAHMKNREGLIGPNFGALIDAFAAELQALEARIERDYIPRVGPPGGGPG